MERKLGFRMKHNTDSIASTKAFKLDKENYMKRKFRGNNPKLGPITPEENLAEANREQAEKYYNIEEKRLKLIPTDDGEVQDEIFKSKLKKWQLAPNRTKSYSKKEGKLEEIKPINPDHLNPPGFEARVPQAVNMTPNASEEEAQAVRDKFDATYMKGRGKVKGNK